MRSMGGWSESETAKSAPCRAKVLSNAKNAFERQGTAKELDEETGLYYYGTMWISTDPALGDYVSKDARGEGGIYNHINLNLYHYAGNNPNYVEQQIIFLIQQLHMGELYFGKKVMNIDVLCKRGLLQDEIKENIICYSFYKCKFCIFRRIRSGVLFS
ncbi:MAG: hypothetical protein J6B81_00505 [Spirochaetaceae bacterium]|nr:hypothetical protein [Spirochaetaceae bacterium]